MAHEDAREEKSSREKLQRERDSLQAQTFAQDQQIQQLKVGGMDDWSIYYLDSIYLYV